MIHRNELMCNAAGFPVVIQVSVLPNLDQAQLVQAKQITLIIRHPSVLVKVSELLSSVIVINQLISVVCARMSLFK